MAPRKHAPKSGFVYIWLDRLRKRFYVGSHWGAEDDGYVCSSKWMKNAFSKRRSDFKRRVLARVDSYPELLKEEQRWLNMIDPNEIKKGRRSRYYNVSRKAKGWDPDLLKNMNPEKKRIMYEKVAAKKRGKPTWMKGKKHSPETIEKCKEASAGKVHSEKTKAKMRESQSLIKNQKSENAKRQVNRDISGLLKRTPETEAKRIAGIRRVFFGKKRGPQSPEHVAKLVASRKASRERRLNTT